MILLASTVVKVAPETGSLRKSVASCSSEHYLTASLAVYPECVSSTVEDGAEPNDPETAVIEGHMRNACSNCWKNFKQASYEHCKYFFYTRYVTLS